MNNKAPLGVGGAICLQSVNIKAASEENIITGNTAAIGGGIYYSLIVPDAVVDKLIFKNN